MAMNPIGIGARDAPLAYDFHTTSLPLRSFVLALFGGHKSIAQQGHYLRERLHQPRLAHFARPPDANVPGKRVNVFSGGRGKHVTCRQVQGRLPIARVGVQTRGCEHMQRAITPPQMQGRRPRGRAPRAAPNRIGLGSHQSDLARRNVRDPQQCSLANQQVAPQFGVGAGRVKVDARARECLPN